MGYNKNYQLAQGTTRAVNLPVVMTKTDGSQLTQVKNVLASGNSTIVSVYKNGESAGTEGLSKRLEAIQIVLVEKGGVAPGKTDTPFVKK